MAPPPILAHAAAPRTVGLQHAMRWAARHHGKSAFRQFRDILALRRKPHAFTFEEYYAYGFFRREFGRARFAEYVSGSGSHALNLRLSPEAAGAIHALLLNKAATALLLERAGLPAAPIRALFARHMRVPGIPALADAEAMAAYLGDPAHLPLFGKPVAGSGGLGSAAILSVSGGLLTLGDGREVSGAALAQEIVARYPEGYLFQPLLRPHPQVEALTGPAIATFRLTTIRPPSGPEPLYAALRMPPKGAMSDGLGNVRPNSIAHVDPATGRILRVQDIARFAPAALSESLATGRPFADAVLPFVEKAARIALVAHGLFPGHGILGFDFALTPEGPLVNEINSKPYHSIYQHSADNGVLNPAFRPRIEAAIAESERLAQRRGG